MKVIFLDIDGVLNSEEFYMREDPLSDGIIDPANLVYVRRIVDETGAQLVLTSSWRRGWDKRPEKCSFEGKVINRALAKEGLVLLDKTGHAASRPVEISGWISQQAEKVEAFVILDDGDFHWKKYGLAPFWVQTNFEDGGLKEGHYRKAMEILDQPPKLPWWRKLLNSLDKAGEGDA